MDYNSLHGPGQSNFSSSSPHRMPTVSAAQALQDQTSSPTRYISTNFPPLDCLLQNVVLASATGATFHGGVSRGKVTEVYGPSGVGKTTLGMQLTTSALNAGEGVLWVDASHPLCGIRMSQFLASSRASSTSDPDANTTTDLLEKLVHISTPTLAHLIALISRPFQNHCAQTCSLMIIDSFSTLISTTYPRALDAVATSKKPGAQNPSTRKFPVLQFIINALQKLAATHNIAVVVMSQCVTKMRPGIGAALVPAVNTAAWEQGLGCRIALFRDWDLNGSHSSTVGNVRLAQVVKAEGSNATECKMNVVGFTITKDHILPLDAFANSVTPLGVLPANFQSPLNALPQKRKYAVADLEIPDSEGEDDEDYGWAVEDDEDLPPPHPQWQGSEDDLVPGDGEPDTDEADLATLEQGQRAGASMGDDGPKERVYHATEIEDSEDELAA